MELWRRQVIGRGDRRQGRMRGKLF